MKMKVFTPLGIIALFISLAEIVAGVVATKTSAEVQLLLALFVVFFPILIAVLFFYVLWHKPLVFYHPKEFDGETTIESFSEVTARRFESVDHWKESTEKAVKEVVEDDSQAQEILKKLVKENAILLDFSEINGQTNQELNVPYDQFESIGLLLRYAWHKVDDIPVNSYGKKWILKDSSGKIYRDIGSTYARNMLGTRWDNRTLESVGITPGMKISVVRPN